MLYLYMNRTSRLLKHVKPTSRTEPEPEPERYVVIGAWMLWLVKALGSFGRHGCCAWSRSRFIRSATDRVKGCRALEKTKRENNSYPRNSATATTALPESSGEISDRLLDVAYVAAKTAGREALLLLLFLLLSCFDR